MTLTPVSLRRACLFGATSAAFILGGATSAAAGEGKPEAIHLRFEVDADLVRECPDESRFTELLFSERPRLSLASDGTAARTFDVRIRRAPSGGVTGEVGVVDVDGGVQTRSIHSRDCRTLVRALAIVAAVASDVIPDTDEPPVAETTPGPKPSRSARVARSTTASREARGARPRPSPSLAPPLGINVGAGTELVLGSLPRSVMGYRAYVDGQRSFGPIDGVLRLSFAFARAQLPDTSRLNVFVQTWTSRLEGCAARRLATPFSIEACVGITGGAFHSYSAGIAGARDDIRPWLTLGAGLRTRWLLGSAMFAELFGNASYVSTVYDTVARDDSGAGHVVPRAVGEIGLGLGHSFVVP